MGWDELASEYRWPKTRPELPGFIGDRHRGWLSDGTKAMLLEHLTSGALIVELGSWTGLSARFILDHAPGSRIVCIDHWKGSAEHQGERHEDILPYLYSMFLHRCWNYRNRIIPLRMHTIDGLMAVSKFGLSPSLIYVDAAHDTESVRRDISQSIIIFPNVPLVGDDFNLPSIQTAVREVSQATLRPLRDNDKAWAMPAMKG